MRKFLPTVVFLLMILLSCNTVMKEASNWIEQSRSFEEYEPQGKLFYLKNGNSQVKPFLPYGFSEKTIMQYKSSLDTILSKRKLQAEMKRLEALRDLKGDFFLFLDSISKSTYTLNTLPYLKFDKKDARMLLSVINNNNDKTSLQTDLNFKKITASFAKNSEFTLFKSIYKVDNFKENYHFFSTFYIISVKQQTFMINLTTPFEVNFDPYIEKMKF